MPLPVYSAAAELYRQAGWPAVIPVPHEGKFPPPVGFTGEEGRDTTPEDIAAWAGNGAGSHDVALRMPHGVIGIDIDQYLKGTRQKVGAETLAACLERWGPLPPTWSSTARGADQPSRILFFQVPAGRYRTVIQPDVEIIQRHHRYAVVWPSIHEELGTTYEWYRPDNRLADRLPSPAELPWLPEPWVAGLREGATDAGPVSAPHAAGEALLARLSLDTRPACSELTDAAHKTLTEVSGADVGTRHDAMAGRVHRYVMSAAHGHAGFGHLVAQLRELWARLTPGEQREAEFERMLITSARKAVTLTHGIELPDPCLAPGGALWSGVAPVMVDSRPRPADNRDPDEDDEITPPLRLELPPRPQDPSWTQVVGADPFEPGVNLDQLLADRMLFRTWRMARRAADTKNAWLLRGAEQWTLEGEEIPRRIVAECASLMPEGDPEPPPKGERNPEHEKFKLRNAMHTNARAGAVASMVKAITAGGRHPATVKLSELDTDPDILWAGGLPWNLRESHAEPVGAPHVHPDTPHLAAAGVMPALVPTPGWDRFLTAVWPDETVRAWCLRVLSIAATGYPDAALPVLFGPGGSGKTSLITLLMEVLGSYAHAANPKLLSDRADQFMTWQMRGRRMSFIDEAMREGHRNAETLKQLTGGGQLTGAAKYQNEVTFPATHTLVLTSNTAPTVHDQALRRRIRLLPCKGDPAEVRAARQALSDTWAYEAPGVLARLMVEAAAWLSDQDSALMAAAPESVQSAMADLVREQDAITQWLDEAVLPNDHGTRARQLYVGFRGWCREGGIRDGQIPSETAWGLALNDHHLPVIHRRDGNYRALVIRPNGGGFVPPPSYPQAVDNSGPVPPPVEGMWRVGGGFEAQPFTPHTPRSEQLLPGSVEGVKGSLRNVVKKSEERGVRGYIGREGDPQPSTPFTDDHQVGAGQALGRVEGCRADPSQTLHTGPQTLHTGPASSHTPSALTPLPITLDPSRKVTPSVVAEVAERLGLSKGEARKLITQQLRQLRTEAQERAKREARQAAIEQASGPTIELPATVDRAGTVLELSTEEAWAAVRNVLTRSPALTVDVETSGYPLGHRHYALRLVQLGDAHEVVVFDAARHASLIRELLAGDFPLIAHSASADLVPLDHARVIDPEQAWERMHDTVIPAKLADPSSTGADPALKKISPAMLGADSTVAAADAARREVWKAAGWLTDTDAETPPERNGWAQIAHNCETMIRYAGSDVLDTAAIAERLAGQLPPTHIYERERLAERMTARVTHQGLALDLRHIQALETRALEGQRIAALEVRDRYGIDNPGSTQQVAQKLAELGAELPRTKPSSKHPDGQPSVAEGVLDPIAQEPGPAGELATRLLAYREHTTALGLFLRPYRALCEHGDGRARPTVYTLGTNTGRMSCVRPNMQQLPRSGGFRAMITANPGELMISADFSGVELRVAAALSGDPALTQLIASGGDLHAEVALLVFNDPDPVESQKRGRPWPKKKHRYAVKSGVFGRLYGGGAPTLSAQMGVRLEVAQRMIDVLDAMLPTLSAWSEGMRRRVQAGETQFQAYNGRVIHLPAARSHAAGNYCIQGSARELLVDAFEKWNQTKWRTCRILPVHDEILVFVPEAEAKEALSTLVQCMASELNGVQIVAAPDEATPAFAWPDSV